MRTAVAAAEKCLGLQSLQLQAESLRARVMGILVKGVRDPIERTRAVGALLRSIGEQFMRSLGR